MKTIILAAGYATRPYPLTENFPKPLLEVGGKPILDHLIGDLDASGLVDGYIVVSNHRFAPIFQDWANKPSAPGKGPGRVPQGEPGPGIACPKAIGRAVPKPQADSAACSYGNHTPPSRR